MGSLATRPLDLLKLAGWYGMRMALIVVVTWTELAKAAVNVHLSLVWKMVVWTIALLSLPFRVVSAMERERQLEMEVRHMESELERVAWERKELRRRQKMMELVLADVDRKAVAKIQLLKDQLRELEKEILRLRQAKGSGSGGGGVLTGDTAFIQSMFSAAMSLWVGIVIWEADQHCMPLVVALFIVVVMSLKSVLCFFSTVKSKPASNVVALLGLNCFILGALTYPTLPTLAPPLFRLLHNAVGFPRFSFS